MTLPNASQPPVVPARRGIVGWFRSKDPDLLVLKRSVRAAVIMPLVFAIAHFGFSNPQVGLFGAFGSFALLLLVEFTGRPHVRLVSYGGLYVAGACFVALGTLVSTNKVAAVVTMALVGFGVLFAGIVAPQAATATTAALLTFVLPVAVAQPVSAIGPRLVGWTIAAVFCIGSCMLVWPPPWHDNLRRRLSAAASAVARLADARSRGQNDRAAYHDVTVKLQELTEQFSGTPYPPTGAASGAVALSKLVGRLEWVADTTVMMQNEQWSSEPRPARAVTEQVAETMHQIAALLCDGEGHPVHDPARIEAVRSSTERLDQLMVAALEADVVSLTDAEASPPSAPELELERRTRASRERSIRASTPAPSVSPPRWWPMRRWKQPVPSQRVAAASAWPTRPRHRPWPTGSCRISPSDPSGSATPCAAQWAWPWLSGWSRSPTSRTASGSCSGRCRCCAPARSVRAPPHCAPWGEPPWGSSRGP